MLCYVCFCVLCFCVLFLCFSDPNRSIELSVMGTNLTDTFDVVVTNSELNSNCRTSSYCPYPSCTTSSCYSKENVYAGVPVTIGKDNHIHCKYTVAFICTYYVVVSINQNSKHSINDNIIFTS